MDQVDAVDELAPVDWLAVEFPGSRFNGQIAGLANERAALEGDIERDLI